MFTTYDKVYVAISVLHFKSTRTFLFLVDDASCDISLTDDHEVTPRIIILKTD